MSNLQTYKIATLNINKITTTLKIDSLRDYIYSAEVDIAMLQEVDSELQINITGYDTILNTSLSGASGTAFLIKEGIVVSEIERMANGRGLSCLINGVRFINIYAPSGNHHRAERSHFYEQELLYLIRRAEEAMVLAGDFNCVLKPKDQQPNFNYSAELDRVIREMRFFDTWELINGDRQCFTFYTSTSASRLDRIYVTQCLNDNVNGPETWPVYFSDHLAYHCQLRMTKQNVFRGRNIWKLNVTVLKDDGLRLRVEEVWDACSGRRRNFPSTTQWWYTCAKPKLISCLKTYCYERHQDVKSVFEFYFRCLRELYECRNPTAETILRIKRVKAKLTALKRKQMEGIIIRSRDHHSVAGEAPSLYHLAKEKRHARCRLIHSLRSEDGDLLNDHGAIKKLVVEYYTKLYASEPADDDLVREVQNSLRDRLSTQDAESLIADVTAQEIRSAMKKAQENKSPGADGLPIEFYKQFWYLLENCFLEICNEIKDGQNIPEGFNEGVIVLIPKEYPCNNMNKIRPISLLNTDYKIVARVMAARIKQVLHKIIHVSQTAAVPGRTILESLTDYRELISYCSVIRPTAAILSLDLNKAFDRIRHPYLLGVMTHLGFGEKFVHMIKNLLKNATSKININGHLTKPVPIEKSVRQGCPLSMTLFVIAVDPLLRRLSERLQGINIYGNTVKCIAYADDVGVVVNNTRELNAVKTAVVEFEHVSGSKLNVQKTKLMPLGPGFPLDEVDNYERTDNLKLLGIRMYSCPLKTTATAWKDILAMTRACLRQNYGRIQNLLERVNFVNTKILSKIWYIGQILPVNDTIAARVMAAVGWYLWRGGIFRVGISVTTLPPRKGGLGVVDVGTKCRALLIRRTLKIYDEHPHSALRAVINANRPFSLEAPVNLSAVPHKLNHIRRFFLDTSYLRRQTNTLRNKTTAEIYTLMNDNGSRNRMETKYAQIRWDKVWKNINNKFLDTDIRSTWYKVVNETIATKEKLHRIKLADTDKCRDCDLIDTLQHRCICGENTKIWEWCRRKLALIGRTTIKEITPSTMLHPDYDYFPMTKQNMWTWLAGHTIHYIINKKPEDTYLDFRLYSIRQATTLLNNPRHKTLFANYPRALELTKI